MKGFSNKERIYLLLIIIFLWVAGTSITQRFKCPKLSETELFLMIPENFILNFNTCK